MLHGLFDRASQTDAEVRPRALDMRRPRHLCFGERQLKDSPTPLIKSSLEAEEDEPAGKRSNCDADPGTISGLLHTWEFPDECTNQ
jgi:hypothetical protein